MEHSMQRGVIIMFGHSPIQHRFRTIQIIYKNRIRYDVIIFQLLRYVRIQWRQWWRRRSVRIQQKKTHSKDSMTSHKCLQNQRIIVMLYDGFIAIPLEASTECEKAMRYCNIGYGYVPTTLWTKYQINLFYVPLHANNSARSHIKSFGSNLRFDVFRKLKSSLSFIQLIAHT